MLAPPVASALFDACGWRIAFLGTALIGLVWLPAWLVSTTRPGVPAQLDTATTRVVEPRPPTGELLRHRALLRALCAIFAVAPIFGVALQWGAIYLAQRFQVTQEAVGHYLWLPPVIFDGASLLFGHLASLQHRPAGQPPRLLVSIGVVLAVSLVALPLMNTPWHGVVLVGIAMAGGGIVYTLATADLLQRMPPGSVSFAAGMMAGAQSLALIIVNPLIGAAVDHFHNFDVAAIAVGAWAVPGCLVWLLWRPR
jgi:predicted MFS family arabinose efflux permease